MRKKRILSFFGVTTMVFIGGIITLILFPQPLFSNSFTYKNYEVYSNYEVNQELFGFALDSAMEIVDKSELSDQNYQYDIFLADNTIYNEFDNFVFGEWSIARAIDNNIVIKRKVDETRSKVRNGNNQFDLVYVLVHEMIHCLQSNKFGKRKFNPFSHPPFWKLEGYPEYVGRRDFLESEEYNLKIGIEDFLCSTDNGMEVDQIIQISETESTPYIYFKGRLMIEYLMDVKGLTYREVLEDTIKEDLIYDEMINWYLSNKE